MDKFDEFLKEKVNNEKSKFIVSKEYDINLEDCLEKLDNNKDVRWKKTIISIAACFVFVLLIGITSRYINVNESLNDNSRISTISEEDRSIQNRAYNGEQSTIDIDNIKSVTIKVLGENSTYKFVDDKKDISSIMQYINSIANKEIFGVELKEWDIFIQVNGETNQSIIVDNNIMNIDNKYFEIENVQVEELRALYSNLNYDELPIKYCDF